MFAAASGLALFASSADAAVNIYISNTGTGVLAQTIGSLDLTGLTPFFRQATSSAAVKGDASYIGTGGNNVTEDGYTGFTGPTTFGDTLRSNAGASAGDAFSFNLGFDSPVVFVTAGYTSGKAINSTANFVGTLLSLELTMGTYVYTSTHDTITLHIGEAAPAAAAVPEPASWALMLGDFGMIGGALRTRRKVAVSFG